MEGLVLEPGEGHFQSLLEVYAGLPLKVTPRLGNIWPALLRVILGQGLKNNLAPGAGQGEHEPGQFQDAKFIGVTQVEGLGERRIHQPVYPFD